jgi:hypothetical protein
MTPRGHGESLEVTMKRVTEYEGWKVEASPVVLVKQRLFQAGAVISRGNERFAFSDLGNRVDRDQAYVRGIEWARRWIDNNYRHRAHTVAPVTRQESHA